MNGNTIATRGVKEMLANAGIKIDATKAKAARNSLSRMGAAHVNISDEVAVAANIANGALKASAEQIKSVCLIAGALRKAEAWKHETDDAGKAYKSENAFLKSLFPGYATSTVSVYADAGATAYLPAYNGELPGLECIKDMTPGNVKFLLSSLKDDNKRAALPAALNKAKADNGGKLTQRAITNAAKSLKDTNAKPDDISTSAGTIADELSGGATRVTLGSLISFAYNGDNADGDLTAIVLERDVNDFMSLLLKARDDADTALKVCATLYTLAKKAK